MLFCKYAVVISYMLSVTYKIQCLLFLVPQSENIEIQFLRISYMGNIIA